MRKRDRDWDKDRRDRLIETHTKMKEKERGRLIKMGRERDRKGGRSNTLKKKPSWTKIFMKFTEWELYW